MHTHTHTHTDARGTMIESVSEEVATERACVSEGEEPAPAAAAVPEDASSGSGGGGSGVRTKQYRNPLHDPERRAEMARRVAQQQGRQRRTVSVVRAPREPRHEQPASAPRRADTLHLYGTDSCSTDDVFAYFAAHDPAFVEWIDDSSCNVVFASAAAAARALADKTLARQDALQTSFEQSIRLDPVTMELVVSSGGDGDGGSVEGAEGAEATVPWVHAAPLCVGDGVVAKLELRQATTRDVRTEARPSRYYGRMLAQRSSTQSHRDDDDDDDGAMDEGEGEKKHKRDRKKGHRKHGTKRQQPSAQEVVFGDGADAVRLTVETAAPMDGAETVPTDDTAAATAVAVGEAKRKRRRKRKRHDSVETVIF